ncbi:MAG: polysaccharide biosynthesis/export family protein, partial [Planctomycetota bacterium]
MRYCRAALGFLLAAPSVMAGCEVASFFDPSKTGRFEHTPTTIPILERIDVIEREHDPWARAVPVTAEDLLPSDLTYRLNASDLLTVEVFELLVQGQVWGASRRIDAAGYFRMPAPTGDVRAAGLTVQEFQDELVRVLDELVLRDPVVNVTLEEGVGFQYTVYGAVAGAGLYGLRRPDLRLLDALAQAGGVPLTTEKIYIIRQVPLSPDLIFEPARRAPEEPTTFEREREPTVDIEELIRQLEERERQRERDGQMPPGEPGDVRPGLLAPAQDEEPPIDIDDLEPVRIAEPPEVDIGQPTDEPPPPPPPTTAPALPPAAVGVET